MRNTTEWSKELRKEIADSPAFRKYLEEKGDILKETALKQGLHRFLFLIADVELGLTLLQQVDPGAGPRQVRDLLAFLPYVVERYADPQAQQMIRIARFYLYTRKGFGWDRSLESYLDLPRDLRLYDAEDSSSPLRPGTPRMATGRLKLYRETLRQSPPHTAQKLRVATAGDWAVFIRPPLKSPEKVTLRIPPEVVAASRMDPPPFRQTRSADNPPIEVSWDALGDTAAEMDNRLLDRKWSPENYTERFARQKIMRYSAELDDFIPGASVMFQGTQHWPGLTNVGKTTVVEILAYYLARRGFRVGIVVGDVATAIRKSSLFRFGLSIPAAPILGRDRMEHLAKSYGPQFARASEGIFAGVNDPARNRWFHGGCALLPFMSGDLLWTEGEEPCHALVDLAEEEMPPPSKRYSCPFLHVCPQHQRERDLADSLVWYMTPQSLVKTPVPTELFPTGTYFAETVFNECDVVLVDEADKVMAVLDQEFAPNQTLVDASDRAFIDRLQQVVGGISPLMLRSGRDALAAWLSAAYTTLNATAQVYTRVQTFPRLLNWVGRMPFTGRSLLSRIVNELLDEIDLIGFTGQRHRREERREHVKTGPVPEEWRARVDQIMLWFKPILDYNLDEHKIGPIGDLSWRLLHALDAKQALAEVRTWCEQWLRNEPILSALLARPEIIATLSWKLEFVLILITLEKQLTFVVDEIPAIRQIIDREDLLEDAFTRPARDYLTVLPEAPIGNITGFRFVKEKGQGDSRDLKLEFSRYVGVGRALLLQFSDLFVADKVAGPHTVLLSGTSFTPGSSAYHIPIRPEALLVPVNPDGTSADLAIAQSEFHFWPQRDPAGNPIRLSGRTGNRRREALRAIAHAIATPTGRAPSFLSLLLADLRARSEQNPKLWGERLLATLVLTNYEEAEELAELLRLYHVDASPEWVAPLRRDGTPQHLPGPRRGQMADLHSFGNLRVLTAVLGAIERGHNPLTSDRSKSILGAVLFVPRPMPVPGDWHGTVQRENSFAWSFRPHDPSQSLKEIAEEFRRHARGILYDEVLGSTGFFQLDDRSRLDLVMSILVQMWQTIARGIRGNVPVIVGCLDAQFAPESVLSEPQPITHRTSLLAAFRWALSGYLEGSQGRPYERTIIRSLYGAFYQALTRMGGIQFGEGPDLSAGL